MVGSKARREFSSNHPADRDDGLHGAGLQVGDQAVAQQRQTLVDRLLYGQLELPLAHLSARTCTGEDGKTAA